MRRGSSLLSLTLGCAMTMKSGSFAVSLYVGITICDYLYYMSRVYIVKLMNIILSVHLFIYFCKQLCANDMVLVLSDHKISAKGIG